MIEMLQFTFIQHALLAALLASLACGIIGSYVVSRKMVFISDGIVHTSYAGIGLGFFMGFNPYVGAVIVAVLAGLALGAMQLRQGQTSDTSISVIWALGIAIGVTLVALTPGYAPDLMSYLFGSILFVTTPDLWLMLALDVVILILVLRYYKPFLSISFDAEFSAVAGLPVAFLQLLLYALIALTVVLLIKVVGLILVVAMLTIPAAIAKMFRPALKTMMSGASLLALLFMVGGIVLSYGLGTWLDLQLPTGAVVILLSCAAYFFASVLAAKTGTVSAPKP